MKKEFGNGNWRSGFVWTARPWFHRSRFLAAMVSIWQVIVTPVFAQTADDFNPGADNSVWSFALQPDGKILAGGYFTNLCGQTRNFIGRLDADGALDLTFNPGASGAVFCLAVQADGKILVGGEFHQFMWTEP